MRSNLKRSEKNRPSDPAGGADPGRDGARAVDGGGGGEPGGDALFLHFHLNFHFN